MLAAVSISSSSEKPRVQNFIVPHPTTSYRTEIHSRKLYDDVQYKNNPRKDLPMLYQVLYSALPGGDCLYCTVIQFFATLYLMNASDDIHGWNAPNAGKQLTRSISPPLLKAYVSGICAEESDALRVGG